MVNKLKCNHIMYILWLNIIIIKLHFTVNNISRLLYFSDTTYLIYTCALFLTFCARGQLPSLPSAKPLQDNDRNFAVLGLDYVWLLFSCK